MKLRKLTDSHYIITSDDNILEGDFVINNLDKLIGRSIRPISIAEVNDKEYSKITHSTQPLEYIHIAPKVKGLKLGFKNIKQLSLSEVEEVINGYNLEEMVGQSFENMGYHSTVTSHEENQFKLGYKLGFKEHKELVKDKLFTIEDIQLAFAKGIQYTTKPYPQNVQFENEFKQSLLPKTEWDIEINEQNKITLL